MATHFFGGDFFGGEFFNSETPPPVVDDVGAGRPAKRTIFRIFNSQKDVEKVLRKQITRKPLKAKVAKVIAQVIADDTEQLETAVQRMQATLESMREPIRADYIDYTRKLVEMAVQAMPMESAMPISEPDDDEIIAIVAMLLARRR
jgi:hypothetical protein